MAINEEHEFLFLTVNHREAWIEGRFHDVEPQGEEGISLRKVKRYTLEYVVDSKKLPRGFSLTDAAVGPCQTLYLLDGKARYVYRYDLLESRFEEWICLYGYCADEPTAIAYAEGGIIVTSREGYSRMLRFAEANGQLIWRVGESTDANGQAFGSGLSFHPDELVVSLDGWLYVLDTDRKLVSHFDANGNHVKDIGAAELNGKQPVALTLSPEGLLHILDVADKQIIAFKGGQFDSAFQIPLQSPSGLAIDNFSSFFVGENRKPHGLEEDRFVHRFDKQGMSQEPIAAYRGNVDRLKLNDCGRLYILDRENGTITGLKLEQVLYRKSGSPLSTGTYYTKAFDKTKEVDRKAWHKLVIDAWIPDDAQIEVSYFTSNENLVDVEGINGWSSSLVNPKELLIRNRSERYLWVRIQLIGNGNQSPIIRSIQAVFPRISYLRYLPAVYQEDEDSRDFLERFLSLFETFLSASERRIDTIARWFDADSVSGDFLRWLASWLAVAYDENWPEDRLRGLVREIPKLYSQRGTRDGMEELIRLFTGERPYIVEHYQLRCAEDEAVIQLLERLFGSDPYHFCVLLKPGQIRTESEYATVRRIVETEKPAHTCGGVTLLEPYIYLDQHTYLGINTTLNKPDSRFDSSIVSRDSVLLNDSPFGQVEISSLRSAYTVLA